MNKVAEKTNGAGKRLTAANDAGRVASPPALAMLEAGDELRAHAGQIANAAAELVGMINQSGDGDGRHNISAEALRRLMIGVGNLHHFASALETDERTYGEFVATFEGGEGATS